MNLTADSDAVCGQCQQTPPFFDRTVAAFSYEEPVRHLIQGLKFHRRYAYGRVLGALLADRLAQCLARQPDCIIPVPLHTLRYRERGFNHATEIAREISRRFRLPIDLKTACRSRATQPQVGLSAEERRNNIRRAFRIMRPCPARHVAILDDVVTTGATVNDLAKLLKNHGVETVDVWACARADRCCPG